MLPRFVRIQLMIFAILGVIGMAAMTLYYIQVPTLLGIGKMTVHLQLPRAGGLYRFSNVTYRGVQIGEVTAVDLTPYGAQATLSLDLSPKIPADVVAEVRSVSAVGEYYVDLRPRSNSGPYLRDGSVIAMRDTTTPQPIGPVLEQSSKLINSIPMGKLKTLLDESFDAFNGEGYEFQSLLESTSTITKDSLGVSDQSQALTRDSAPLLDAQADSADAIRRWARGLANVTGTVAKDAPQVRSLLRNGPGAFDESARLLNEIKPTLPVMLANLTTLGQIAVTYHSSIEQLLVLMPPFVAATQSGLGTKSPVGMGTSTLLFSQGDPPLCTVGFLPPSQWRSPADTTTINTPDGMYCKLPQDSPISVRGVRNDPCPAQPGKRAPTVEICDSDRPFMPLAMRQHFLGTYPLDPKLISQGIPPDDRMGFHRDLTFGPVDGTPMPPGAVPRGAPPGSPTGSPPPLAPPGPVPVSIDTAGIAPTDMPSQGPASPLAGSLSSAEHSQLPVPSAAPSAFGRDGSHPGPSIAVAQYNPHTGTYVGPDGTVYRQSDLVAKHGPKTWKELVGG